MYISEARLLNYKSFNDSGLLQLEPGINVIVGQNSAGKTALLEALSLSFLENPHKSLLTVPDVGIPPPPNSRLELTLNFSKDDLVRMMRRLSGQYFLAAPIVGT